MNVQGSRYYTKPTIDNVIHCVFSYILDVFNHDGFNRSTSVLNEVQLLCITQDYLGSCKRQ